MGEAKRRGSEAERTAKAIQRDKADFYAESGLLQAESEESKAISVILEACLGAMAPGEWTKRKSELLARIARRGEQVALKDVSAIRDVEDEIAWYLYLAEISITDPLCQETNQAARALPYLAALGQKWPARDRVIGMDKKIRELVSVKRAAPDGALFELLVALSYAECGWDVEMLAERPPAKTPDLLVSRDGMSFYVECKRQSRRPKYSAEEHQHFLELWDGMAKLVRASGQWLWFDIVFHQELSQVPSDVLTRLAGTGLPKVYGPQTLRNDALATVRARPIDQVAVKAHLASNLVKSGSRMLRELLGGDWAPKNSDGPMAVEAKGGRVKACDQVPFNHWIDELRWAAGCTWTCDAPLSVAAKARDIKRLLVDAVRQVPPDHPSIIHIAVETSEGREVDRLRAERIRSMLATFKVDRPVAALFVHSIQCNSVSDKPWEVDETVDWYFGPAGVIPELPRWILLPAKTQGPGIAHWALYP